VVRFFKLGSFGNFGVFNQRDAGPNFLTTVGHRSAFAGPPSRGLRCDTGYGATWGATMAMIVLSSPATLTGAGEKKTGPSRFRPDFLTELTKFRNYKRGYT
jgi:hypothetical protein